MVCRWNLENNKNESIYKAETGSQMQKQTNSYQTGKVCGEDKLGEWD